MLSMIPSVIKGVSLADLDKIKTITRAAFPSVKQIGAKTLAEWIAKPKQSLLLVDVRSPREFAVSHLRGAINLRNASEIARAISERKPAKTVLYCAVGFRSSQIARRIPASIACEVFNLEGSIFEWVNQGHPIYRGEQVVWQVHPFGERWKGLLKPGLASDCA